MDSAEYSDTRHSKMTEDMDNWPQKESMARGRQLFNGKVHDGLLVRFLRTRVGEDWDQVYHEIVARIPSEILHQEQWVVWFVATKVERRPEGLWDTLTHRYLQMGPNRDEYFHKFRRVEFYVDPETNLLMRIKDLPSGRATKDMNTEELRAYREEEKRQRQEYKREKTKEEERTQTWVKEALQQHNKRE
ncbi:MAG: hypothetical protein AAFQ98_15180 [Bacteroidota bacterium]